MTRRQKGTLYISIVIILLILFIWIYFRNEKKGEKCPDGRSIPLSGNCADNAPLTDSNGNAIVTAQTPDVNGCIQPSSYITNSFPLGLGMKGQFVKDLQSALNVQYGESLQEDVYFGCNTLKAVKKAFNLNTIDAEFYKNNIPSLNVTM